MIVVWLIVAGGLGAVARFGLDSFVRSKLAHPLPLGTMIINVTGSFLLGLITGLIATHLAPDAVRLILGTGFLGGYTTFSTASFETVRLVRERRVAAALLNGFGTILVTVAAAALGYALAFL